MNQSSLCEIIESCGFTVLAFEYHPGFFGNWRAYLKRGHLIYEVAGDNREGWLTLWRRGEDAKIFEVESWNLSQEEELVLLRTWLEEVRRS